MAYVEHYKNHLISIDSWGAYILSPRNGIAPALDAVIHRHNRVEIRDGNIESAHSYVDNIALPRDAAI